MSVFNAVVPFGAAGWKGAEVVLWQLGIKVAVERGDCFMFEGAIVADKACAVTEGHRNFIDLFCHKSVYDIQNRVKEKASHPKSTDIRKVCFIFHYFNVFHTIASAQHSEPFASLGNVIGSTSV